MQIHVTFISFIKFIVGLLLEDNNCCNAITRDAVGLKFRPIRDLA